MNNFIGEFLTLRGAFEANVVWGALATLGIILGAAYMLWLYQRVFFGQVTNPANESLPDLDAREFWQFAPLIALIFLIGIYPSPILSYINPQTETVVAQVSPGYFNVGGTVQARTGDKTDINTDAAEPAGPQPERRAENESDRQPGRRPTF